MKPEITFVAADFVVDTTGKLYFIELNNFPSISSDYKDIVGNYGPIEELVKLGNGDPLILIFNAKKWREGKALKMLYDVVKKVVPINHELYIWSKKLGEEFEISKLKNRSGIIYTPNPDIRGMFESNQNYQIVNRKWVRDLCRDKKKVHKILQNNLPEILPSTYEFTNREELKRLIDSLDFDGVVVKPRYGSKGGGVYVLDKKEDALSVDLSGRDHWLFQERIDNFDKQRKKYYDIRIYLLNGKPVGAMSRVSDNPVVNVSLGGHLEKVDTKIKIKADELAQKIYQLVFRNP